MAIMSFTISGKCKMEAPIVPAAHRLAPLALALIALVLLGWQQPAAATTPAPFHFLGRAFDLDSGKLVYTEEHAYRPSGLYTVIYREPDGQQFATKTADFSDTSFAPGIEQLNDRNGELIRIARKDSSTLAATYRATREKTAASTEIEMNGDTVIDAGFHSYILAHWDKLIGGKAARIEYLVPSWQRLIALNINASRCADPQRQCFSIKPANALLEMFATPLDLIYDAQSRQLIEFRGTSNIAQRNGDYHRVRIVYEYSPESSAVANVQAD